MSDTDKPLIGLHGTAVEHASKFMRVIQLGVLAVSVAAAIPTAQNLYYSWSHGIPFSEVSHRLQQYDLWMKNLECKIEYRALNTASGSKVDVGACKTTGDIAIKVSGSNGAQAYEWIAFDQLKKAPALAATGFLDLFISPAYAETSPKALAPAGSAATGSVATGEATVNLPKAAAERGVRVAEGMEVMCQKKQGDKIVRVVKDGAKCFKEVVSPLKGSVESRSEVACGTGC